MKFSWVLYILPLCLSLNLCAEEKPTTPSIPAKSASPQKLFDLVCAVCHGKDGEGSKELTAPSIAGLPHWYIMVQIEKFKNDLRGTNSKDQPGQIMHNLAKALDKQQFLGVAKLIATMPMHPTQNHLGGDIERGKEVFTEVCAKCHRFNGKGEVAFGSAPLIGLQDWYIQAQLHKFREGIRGGSKADEKGFKMHEMARYLSEKDAANVTAHIAVLAQKYANTKSRRDREIEALNNKKDQKASKQGDLPKELRK